MFKPLDFQSTSSPGDFPNTDLDIMHRTLCDKDMGILMNYPNRIQSSELRIKLFHDNQSLANSVTIKKRR